MPINSRNKGKAGEREIIDLWQPLLDRITHEAEHEPILLQRNTLQSDRGGADITGLPWIAVEIKRCQQIALPAWWRQACGQAKNGQLIVLAFRINHCPWMFCAGSPTLHKIMDQELFMRWFEKRIRLRLQQHGSLSTFTLPPAVRKH